MDNPNCVSAEELKKQLSHFGSLESPDTGNDRSTVRSKRRPPWLIPSILLISSLLSMMWAGMVAWSPVSVFDQAYSEGSFFVVRYHVLANWKSGLLFAVSLTIILGAHELGHYFATRFYRIPSTLPLFIPFPISPAGTCGAVIMMDGSQADRKQIFDIGIAGPLTGLFFAIPIAVLGLMYGAPPTSTTSTIQFGQPLFIQWLDGLVGNVQNVRNDSISNSSMNPMLMAAWVGLLVTGLNMIPVSQLDGGHVIFGLLGRRSRIVSWIAYLLCACFVVYSAIRYKQPDFAIMLLLIPLMGIGHPPSRNDHIQLDWARTALGLLSLTIPIVCIPLRPISLLP